MKRVLAGWLRRREQRTNARIAAAILRTWDSAEGLSVDEIAFLAKSFQVTVAIVLAQWESQGLVEKDGYRWYVTDRAGANKLRVIVLQGGSR